MIIFVIEMIQLEMIAIIKENDALPEVVTEVSATHDDNDDDNGEYEEEDKQGLMHNLR